MEHDFYKGRLADRHGLNVIVPDPTDRATIHRVIYEELVMGIVKQESRREYLRVIATLKEAGAEAVIAGCTEIGLLIQQEQLEIPLFDTTIIHAEAAVEWAL